MTIGTDICIQLYNLMQQRIAQEAKSDSESMRTIADASRRDSLEMKGIAWLTMTFLPMTALAVSTACIC